MHGLYTHIYISDMIASNYLQHKRKMKSREKNAALLIENYYKQYKEVSLRPVWMGGREGRW